GRFGAQRTQAPQPVHEPGPVMGDQRYKKPRAARRPQPARRREKILQRQIILLKVDPAVAVYLQIEQPGRQPSLLRRRTGDSVQVSNAPPCPADANRLSRRKMPGLDLAVVRQARLLPSNSSRRKQVP